MEKRGDVGPHTPDLRDSSLIDRKTLEAIKAWGSEEIPKDVAKPSDLLEKAASRGKTITG